MKNLLNKRHKGVGGLVFITSSAIAAFIMAQVVSLSWGSSAIAIADNYAHIVALNTANKAYISNTQPFSGTNPVIADNSRGANYSPLDDFNQMVRATRIAVQPAEKVSVTWTGRKATVQVGEFQTRLGLWVTPHKKVTAIENE